MSARSSAAPQGSETAVSTRVLAAVAEAEGTDPVDLVGVLYDEVDPDALDALYRDGRSGVTVTFTFLDYRVTIDEGGAIVVDGN